MRHICFEKEGWANISNHGERLCSQAPLVQQHLAAQVVTSKGAMDLGKLCHLAEHSTTRHVPAKMHTCKENGTFIHSQWDCKLV